MAYPVPYLPTSYLEANALSAPDRPAIFDSGRVLSFGELRERVHAAAWALREAGLRPGEVAAVALPNVWEYVVLELAIPLLGAVLLPLPPSLGEAEKRWALQFTGARLTVQQPEAERLCSAPYRGRLEPPQPDPDRVVEIALTSGTTGRPKLASLHAALKQSTFEAFTSRLEVTAEDRVLIITPVTQGIGGMCLYCLRRGAALVMLREPRFSPEHTLRTAAATASTLLVGVPTNVIRMLDSPELAAADLSAARCTAVAGSPMPPEAARLWETRTGSRVCVFYGSMDAGQAAVGSPSDPQEKRWTTVGRPHDRVQVRITSEGEICMRGPTVQNRYWGEERGPYAADGWAHMGDLGFLDEDGYLHVTGRLKDVVIRGGSNVNPHEVEDALRSHPAVADVSVVGRPDRELGERLVAFVVARGALRLGDLQLHLGRLGLAKYKWPELLELVDEIPLSGPGKVNRKLLREWAARPAGAYPDATTGNGSAGKEEEAS
ncbi:MAG TPA: class I adenylate-forming enzyme family protein [Candidatus Dormibacteraeota bacterium]